MRQYHGRPAMTIPARVIGGNLLALLFGTAFVLVGLLATETALRYHYDDPAPFYYSLSPRLLNHSALFKRSLVPRHTDPAPRVFCLGGSTTNGCNMPIGRSYPNILNAFFQRDGKCGTAYNFGISGVNSVTTNSFIKEILPPYDPGCVVIHDGYNDLPIVIEKLAEDRYTYIIPDYHTPFTPYIRNPAIRYLSSFVQFNFRALRRFTITFVKKKLRRGGDLFLGFDYKRFPLHEGTTRDILEENKKRIEIMIPTEIDSIEHCLVRGIKVIVILEPYIKPNHFVPPFGTGFRDENVGFILSECHKIQQSLYLMALAARYKSNENVIILDMRKLFEGRYDELFYDECHLNGKGNAIKAQYVYSALNRFFDLTAGTRPGDSAPHAGDTPDTPSIPESSRSRASVRF